MVDVVDAKGDVDLLSQFPAVKIPSISATLFVVVVTEKVVDHLMTGRGANITTVFYFIFYNNVRHYD